MPKIWAASLVLACGVAAGTSERISLLPVLDHFKVGTGDTKVIPLACSEDIALTADDFRKRARWSGEVRYPIKRFAGAPSLSRVALTVDPEVLPEKDQERKRIAIVDLISERATLVKTLELKGRKSISELDFVTEDLLRVETLGRGGPLGYRRTTQFISISKGEWFDLEGIFELPGKIINVRAFTRNFYLIGYIQKNNTNEQYRFAYLNFETGERKLLGSPVDAGVSEDHVRVSVYHNPVDERDLHPQAKEAVRLDISLPISGGWLARSLVVSKDDGIKLIDRPTMGSQLVYGTFDYTVSEIAESWLELQHRGSQVASWILPHPDAYGRVYSHGNDFLMELASHPLYGFLLLKKSGEVIQLNSLRERMIFSNIHPEGVIGVSELNSHGTVDVIRIPVAG